MSADSAIALGAAESAAASATTAATLVDAAVDYVGDLSGISTSDGVVSALIDTVAGPLTQAALAVAIGERVAGTLPLPLRGVESATEVTRPLDVLADGVLYGVNGATLKKSVNSGTSWTTVQASAGDTDYGNLIGLRDLGDGEVLLIQDFGLMTSTGWAANHATATWADALIPAQVVPFAASFYPFGVSTNPDTGRATATQYGGGADWSDSRYVWLSEDFGATWDVVYDVDAHSIADGSDTHLHFTELDPWADDRLWTSWHSRDGTEWKLIYSDDFGSTWDELDTDDQPTVGVAATGGMVFATDGLAAGTVGVNGLYVVRRTAVAADMRYDLAWEWPGSRASELQGFGFRGFRDPDSGLVYIGFVVDGGSSYPVIAASDGIVAAGVYESPTASATTSDGFQNVMVDGLGKLIAAQKMGGVWTTLVADASQRGALASSGEDPGRVLGGRADKNQTAAVGFNAQAKTNTQATAVGVDSVASGGGSVAAGFSADATFGGNVAVGRNAQAVHAATVAVGEGATSTEEHATMVGRNSGAGARSVAVGSESDAGDDSVVIGGNATGTAVAAVVGGSAVGGAWSAVIGYSAQTLVTRATALGAQAVVAAGHDTSVALGDATATSAANQLAIGPRHIELAEITAGLGNAPTNKGRLWFEDNGSGKTRLMVRFPTGAAIELAIEP